MKIISRLIGGIETAAGLLAWAYIALWLAGNIHWSADIAFAAMGAMGLFFIIDGISRLARGKSILWTKSKGVNGIVQGMFLAVVCLMLFVQGAILQQGSESAGEETDYAVIFGAKVYGKSPSAVLSGRIDLAAEYLHENPEAIAIACGGYGAGNSHSEAQVILQGLLVRGIDEDRIILEDKSLNSRENVQNALEIISSRGGGSVTVITSDYHVYRCVRLFKAAGMAAYGLGSDIALPLRPIAHFREMLSVLRDYALDAAKMLV
ncbi:MAG: YdcF family protein [Christensenellales bacterium]|jgi:uncharacterized SAM-binding protein YcdF (DUF218 family)